jgi:tetratricopeptide (TPR) repeat protein
MVATMSSCPAEELLRSLGTDALGDATYTAIEEHVEDCPVCKEVLERLAHRLPDSPVVLPGPQRMPRIPGFEIQSELGRSAMSVVYLAIETGLDRRVALKILPGAVGADASTGARRRWLREARAVSSIRHPNVVPLYDYGEADGWFYLVLEYVPGGTLKQRLTDPLPPRVAAGLVETISRAVGSVHDSGLLHLDLKPSNILLDCTGDTLWHRATPRVSDFGLALDDTDVGPSEMSMAGPRGTPSYMAPEQTTASRAQIGPATDVYALGAILYELLTGRPPFQGTSTLETLDQVRGQEPVTPRRLNPKIPRDLETIVLKCLEKSPSRRYISSEALADDLRRWLDGRPITARRASPVEHAWRGCRRNPVVSSLAAALAVTIALGFVVLVALLRNAQARQRTAEANYRIALNTVKDAASLSPEMLKPGASEVDDPFTILLRGLRSQQTQLCEARQDSQLARDQLVEIDIALAHRLARRGALREAETILRAADGVLAKGPTHSNRDCGFAMVVARVRSLLGAIANSEHRFEEAVTLFAGAIEKLESLEPGASSPHSERCLMGCQVQLGAILLSLGRKEEGQQWLRRGAQTLGRLPVKEGFDQNMLQAKARMLLLLGDREGARETLRIALRAFPGTPGIAVSLSLELLESADSLPPGDQRQAMLHEAHKTLTSVSDAAEALALRDPGIPENIQSLTTLYQYIARALMNLGRREDAIAALQRFFLLNKALNRKQAPHSRSLNAVWEPLAMFARIAITPRAASEAHPHSSSLWDSAHFMAETIGIDSTSLPEIGWKLVMAESPEAALCRQTDRLDRARDIVSGLEEFARQLVAQYPQDPFAHLAMSEAHVQISKNAWRGAGPAEVEDALRQALDSARRALALDPRNVEAQRAVLDRQRRFASLQAHH